MLSQLRRTVVAKVRGAVQRAQGRGLSTPTAATPSMEAPAIEVYNGGMQVMHWASGLAVLGCVGFVQAAQYTKGKTKGRAMFLHKSFGLLAAILITPRLALRLASTVPKHLPGPTWEVMAANASHLSLYGFLIFMPASGVAMGYWGGKGLPFFYTTVPGAAKADGEIAKVSYKYHKLIYIYTYTHIHI
jgi:cytochrome b561